MNIKLRYFLAALIVLVSACAFARPQFEHENPSTIYVFIPAVDNPPTTEDSTAKVLEEFADLFDDQANASAKYANLLPERRDYFRGRAEALHDASMQLREASGNGQLSH